jgi:hypothetical protein
MAKRTKQAKRRTAVKELPKEKRELNEGEQKKVKGGAGNTFVLNLSKPQGN